VRWCWTVVALVLLGTPAMAQEDSVDGEALDEAERASLDQEARANFEAGRIAYGDARYEAALRYFEQAYELSERPALLYNIGQSLDRLRRDGEALEAFEAFLEQNPETPKRREVEVRIELLRERAEQDSVPTPTETAQTAVDPPPPVTPVAPPRDEEPSRGWIWGVVAGAAVLVVLGVVLAVALTSDPGTEDPIAGNLGVIEL